MRIRKRKVPLPISLLSPVPLSDPHLFSRSPVIMVQQHEQQHEQHEQEQPPPSDPVNQADLSRLIVEESSTSTSGAVKEQLYSCLGFEGDEKKLQASNDASNATGLPTTGAVAAPNNTTNNNNGPPQLGLLSNQDNGKNSWSDRDRVVPLKKRRGSFEQQVIVETTIIGGVEKEKMTMKSKTNKMCITPIVEEKEEEQAKKDDKHKNVTNSVTSHDNGNNNNNNNNNGGAKRGMSKRGNTIMEGSRCSRVNGRGWRCCQPTLVGYSLCEHHLGKGRLRSMTSNNTRGRSSLPSKKVAPPLTTSSPAPVLSLTEKELENAVDNDYHDEVAEKPVSTVNSSSIGKRVKLGVVKARSLSSLLGQTTNTTTTSKNSNNTIDVVKPKAALDINETIEHSNWYG